MTPGELYTRCPTCKTVFRTREEQLAVQSGKVRCGQCRMVFDGRAHLVDLLPTSETVGDKERLQGPPTVTLRDSLAFESIEREASQSPAAVEPDAANLNAAAGPNAAAEPGNDELPAATEPASAVGITAWGNVREPVREPGVVGEFEAPREAPDSAADIGPAPRPAGVEGSSAASPSEPEQQDLPPKPDPDAALDSAAAPVGDGVVSYDWRKDQAPPPRPGMRWTLAISALVLLGLLAGQAVFQFRHAIAASYPQLRPNLVAACAAFGCTIDALRRREEITIESHDLQADPAHQGLLILQVTLRNHASHPVAFPHLELEILDAAGQPQARRALAPVDYAGGAADFARGMPANAEWNVKLFLDASSLAARGYNLDLFYP